MAEQSGRGNALLGHAVGFLRRQIRRLPPKWLHRIGRIKARLIPVKAEQPAPTVPDNRPLVENADQAVRDLQGDRAQLARARAEIAALAEDNRFVRAQHAEIAGHAAHLADHNRVLTEAATDRARELQEKTAKLTQAYIDIAVLSQENERLKPEHAAMSQRAAELAAHNELLTASAIETATRLRACESKLAQALAEVTTLSRDNEHVRVEHALQAQRAAELLDHNHVLTESATETARKLQQRDAELTKALVEIATLTPENTRLRAEHAFYAKRAAEFEDHNRLLTESAIERATKLQYCEDKLTRVEGELTAAMQEIERMRSELAALSGSGAKKSRRAE